MALSDVHWKGLKALQVMADTLPDKIAGPKLKQAYRYALTPTRTAQRNNLPRRSGALWYATDITVGGQAHNIESIFAVAGPRRKKNVWNQQGWHANLVEFGTKKHIIDGAGKSMPIFKGSRLVGYSKRIEHPGSRGTKPFKMGIDSTWKDVASRASDKVAEIIRKELSDIKKQFGNIATR